MVKHLFILTVSQILIHNCSPFSSMTMAMHPPDQATVDTIIVAMHMIKDHCFSSLDRYRCFRFSILFHGTLPNIALSLLLSSFSCWSMTNARMSCHAMQGTCCINIYLTQPVCSCDIPVDFCLPLPLHHSLVLRSHYKHCNLNPGGKGAEMWARSHAVPPSPRHAFMV